MFYEQNFATLKKKTIATINMFICILYLNSV